jgi:hypothetical protein
MKSRWSEARVRQLAKQARPVVEPRLFGIRFFEYLHLCQFERAASHSSMCGQVNFCAPLPAIMPI